LTTLSFRLSAFSTIDRQSKEACMYPLTIID